MNTINTTLKIRTLGGFSISVTGIPVATEWSDETLKVLFCSLLSPLEETISWERICRSTWGIPVTQTSMQRLNDFYIKSLKSFLFDELGFCPLITGDKGIRLNLQRNQVDSHLFHDLVVEGLRLLSLGNTAAALEKLRIADDLYVGSFLPGLPGTIIADTRSALETMHKTGGKDTVPCSCNPANPGWNCRSVLGLYLLAA